MLKFLDTIRYIRFSSDRIYFGDSPGDSLHLHDEHLRFAYCHPNDSCHSKYANVTQYRSQISKFEIVLAED